jgi:hypothetical protein
MKTIELIGRVDENRHLCVELPHHLPPGPVRITLETVADLDDEKSHAWEAAIAQDWAADWSDPREDIYTAEDGKPTHERRCNRICE